MLKIATAGPVSEEAGAMRLTLDEVAREGARRSCGAGPLVSRPGTAL